MLTEWISDKWTWRKSGARAQWTLCDANLEQALVTQCPHNAREQALLTQCPHNAREQALVTQCPHNAREQALVTQCPYNARELCGCQRDHWRYLLDKIVDCTMICRFMMLSADNNYWRHSDLSLCSVICWQQLLTALCSVVLWRYLLTTIIDWTMICRFVTLSADYNCWLH